MSVATIDPNVNFGRAIVSTGYDAGATSIVLQSGEGAKLPAAPFNATWWNYTDYPDPVDDPNREIVRVTSKATDTLQLTRAQEGTSATIKNANSKQYRLVAGLTAKTLTSDLEAKWALADGPVLYVDNANGDDDTAVRGDPRRPWATIGAAVTAAAAYDTILIMPGVYQVTPIWNGDLVESQAPILIKGKDHLTLRGLGYVEVNGGNVHGEYMILDNCSFITVENIHFVGNKPWPLYEEHGDTIGLAAVVHLRTQAGPVHHVKFRYCEWYGYAQHALACLLTRTPYEVVVEHCHFEWGGFECAPAATKYAISSIAHLGGGLCLVTCPAAHGLTAGKVVRIWSVTPATYNGYYAISENDATSFYIVVTPEPTGNATIAGTWQGVAAVDGCAIGAGTRWTIRDCTFLNILRGVEIENGSALLTPMNDISVMDCVFDQVWNVAYMIFSGVDTPYKNKRHKVDGCVFRNINNTIKPATMEEGYPTAINLGGGRHIQVNNCLFSECRFGIYAVSTVTWGKLADVLVNGCHFEYVTARNIQVTNFSASYLAENISITNNSFYDCNSEGSNGVIWLTGRTGIVANNRFALCNTVIQVDNNTGVESQRWLITGNLFRDVYTKAIDLAAGVKNCFVHGNMISDKLAGATGITYGGGDGHTVADNVDDA